MLPGIRAELESLRRRHSAALELMGERDEEVHGFFFFGSLLRMLINFHLWVLWRGIIILNVMVVCFVVEFFASFQTIDCAHLASY